MWNHESKRSDLLLVAIRTLPESGHSQSSEAVPVEETLLTGLVPTPSPSFLVELEARKLDSAENLPEDKRSEKETEDLLDRREEYLNSPPAFLSWLLPRKVVKKKK